MGATLINRLSPTVCPSRSQGSVGIDLGTYGLKIARVRRSGNALSLEMARIVPYRQPLDTVNSSRAVDVILESLDQAWAPTGRWFPDEAACLLPLRMMLLRTMSFPSSSPADQQRTIESELAHDASTSRREMVIECWQEGEPEGRVQTASVLGAPSDLTEAIGESLYQRGLACEVIDGQPFALSRAITLERVGDLRGPVAVIDWGYESSLFVVAKHGSPVYTRPLRECGFRFVSQALCTSLNLESRELEHLLSSPRSFSEDSHATTELQAMLLELAAEPLHRFEEELCRTMTFLRQQRTSLMPERICLTGGGAMLPGFSDWVTQSTGIRANLWEFPSAEAGNSPVSRTQMSLLAPAIALSTLGWND